MAPVIVALGNTAPIFTVDGEKIAHDERVVTTATVHDEDMDGNPVPLADMVRDVAHDEGLDPSLPGAQLSGFWHQHSASPPAWVETTRADLTEALARAFGCRIGRPADWTS